MAHLQLKGFILRVQDFGEADRLVSILSDNQGLVRVFARGSRRPRSPLRLATQIFVLSQFDLFSYKDRLQLDSAEVIEPFLGLQQDMDRLICAAHLAEVFYDGAEHDLAQPALYQLFGHSLQSLTSRKDPLLTVHTAQQRMLRLIGLAPRLDACVVCSREPAGPVFFSVRSCGIVCERAACRQQAGDAVLLKSGTISCLLHCQQADLSRLFTFSLDPDIRQAFMHLSQAYLVHQMEKPYQRLDMLRQLQAPSDQNPRSP